MDQPQLFTVGHSNRSIEEFVELLQSHAIAAVGDVRSQPSSRYCPHFNRDPLHAALREAGVSYVFLGHELGARRAEPECYVDGQVNFDRVVRTPLFRAGLDRVRRGAERFRLALMCAEKDPLACHRTILIARSLRDEFDIGHLVSPDEVESQTAAEQRLLRNWKLNGRQLFTAPEELLADAYSFQARDIGWAEDGEEEPGSSENPSI